MADNRPRRATASDIARAAGVSRATVGFVLNETAGQTISAATTQRVWEEARRLEYRPHLHARALVSGESKIVLVLLPEYPVEHNLAQLLDEASTTLDTAGYTLVTTDPRAHRASRPLWDTLQPDVVISLDALPAGRRASIERCGARVVSADEATRPAESVETDVIRGAAVQIEHLVDRGHTNLVFASTAIASMREMTSTRFALAATTAAALGADIREVVVDRASAAGLVAAWRADGVTGVAAFNDGVAALVLGASLRSGLAVPSDLAIIGHDDIPLAELLVPSLSTVRVDTTGLGKYFASVAISAARGEPMPEVPAQLLRAQLVVRESS